MYLVELRPGKEELYRTGDDLAAAIRSGEVDGHSRIYHRSTSKWISITLHPQYKAIVSEKSAHPADRNNWTYLNAQSETLEGAVPDPESTMEAAPEAQEESGDERDDTDRDENPWRRPLALSISGLFLIFGIQLAFSGPRPRWSSAGSTKVRATEVKATPKAVEQPANSSQVVSLASTSTAWTDTSDELEKPAPPRPAAAPLPKAPELGVSSLDAAMPVASEAAREADAKSVDGLLAAYSKAYDAARGRLSTGIRVARLNHLFATSRLGPDGGVTDTRLGLAGVANVIRVYRDQEDAIEREFQDSFTSLSKDNGWSAKTAKRWYSREAQKEAAALAALTDGLMVAIDSVLAVLSAEAGAYKMVDGKIHFEDETAAREYGTLRRRINAAVDSARIAGGEESQGPMGHLLKAIGGTRLPLEI
jgi:hypothetical protein